MAYLQTVRSTGFACICRRLREIASRETDTRDNCLSPVLRQPSWRRCDSSRRPVHVLVRPRLDKPPSSCLQQSTRNRPPKKLFRFPKVVMC